MAKVIRSKRAGFLVVVFLWLSTPRFAVAQEAIHWVFTNYPPANYQTEDGSYKGFFHDIVIEVFQQRMGVAVKISVLPWKRCQMMVQNGDADLMVTIPTPERRQYAVTHEKPIWTKKRILFTYRDHPRFDRINRVNGLADIKKEAFSVVSYLGNGWVEDTVQGAGIPVLFATTVDGMYRMLSARRGDIIIEEKGLAMPLIDNLNLSHTIVQTGGIASESGFHILIGKRSAYATWISRIDQEIEAMRSSGEIARILKRYDAGA